MSSTDGGRPAAAGPSTGGGMMPLLQQSGQIFVGPGAKTEAKLIGLGLTNLSSRQKDDLERAKRYAREQSIKHFLYRQQVAQQQNQQKLVRYSQALSMMSRLYVGSISQEVREDILRQMFAMFGPIKSLNMCWDTATGRRKGYAFLEYEVPEASLLALQAMDGKSVGGRSLTVKTPSNMAQAQSIVDMVVEEASHYHRIYVASVHPELSELELRTVFEAFGEIVKVQLAKHPSGKGHRGFGYIEFKSAQAVKEAIEGMNGFDLGGQLLQVGTCVTPPDALCFVLPGTSSAPLPAATAAAAAALSAKILSQELGGGGSPANRASGLLPASVMANSH